MPGAHLEVAPPGPLLDARMTSPDARGLQTDDDEAERRPRPALAFMTETRARRDDILAATAAPARAPLAATIAPPRPDITATEETRGSHAITFAEETRLRSDVAFTPEIAAEPAVPAGGRIGRFVVLRELGRGAMGVVFAAYDEELDRKVAIKLLHAGRGAEASQGRTMLLREAQAMARLAHPNVVAVHEVGVIQGAVFVAMEHVAGIDLQRWLATAKRPWREVLAILRQAGEGLVAAHREGLVHRDFKPSNVLVGDDGRVRVADFGLAARRSDSDGHGRTTGIAPLTATLTGEGALIGTPVYMAPELLRGAPATAQSDQYAYDGSHPAPDRRERPSAGDRGELAASSRARPRGRPPRTPGPAPGDWRAPGDGDRRTGAGPGPTLPRARRDARGEPLTSGPAASPRPGAAPGCPGPGRARTRTPRRRPAPAPDGRPRPGHGP